MKSVIRAILFLAALGLSSAFAQFPEFIEPWKNPNVAIVIDPFEGNDIDWDKLATDKRVVAIIHRATIGDRVDRKYADRKIEAKKRGYKWGAYHYGKPGDPIKQADFFLETVKPEPDDLIALDLESTDFGKHMSFDEARVFINRIKEKTGRYPFVYANNLVVKAINDSRGPADVFSRTPLWYGGSNPWSPIFRKARGAATRFGSSRARLIAHATTAHPVSTRFPAPSTTWISTSSMGRLKN
ncbi:MAG TPA: glycoside hydrolase family 25 protein [Pyrinomonadaceae bacterium]|jgi:GH25 family lysozyme M1 (1,4-beta-N-acetylmuramidase)|nr:glycoside hydrolase family 25 protein [Pyrinomonadaceae bacterium]